jgi:iron complex outermembrane receptor protein
MAFVRLSSPTSAAPPNCVPDLRVAARVAIVLAGLTSQVAFADSSSPAQLAPMETPPVAGTSADIPVGTLKTVTISATHRLEPVRDVPVAVYSLSADEQLELGAKNLGDILATVPGVSYDQQGRAGTGDVVIRGVSVGFNANPAVRVYLDDVPVGSSIGLNSGGAFDQRLLDLEDIEILKGPQGTLYGASAIGGLIKYNTRHPEFDVFSGAVAGEASSSSHGRTNYTASGNLNIPLSEGVAAFRAAVLRSREGGFVDATGRGQGTDINGGGINGVRLSLGLKPYRDLNIRLSAQTQDANYDGLSAVSYTSAGNPVAGDLVRDDLRYGEPFRLKNSLLTLNVEAKVGWATVHSITGYQTERFTGTYDYNNIFAVTLPSYVTQTLFGSATSLNKTTQEFRLVSPSGGTIEWLGGLFYSGEKSGGNVNLTATTAPGAPLTSGSALYNRTGVDTDWRETAAYATVTWNATSVFALTGGMRMTHQTLSRTNRSFGLLALNRTTFQSNSESPATYLLAARYKLTSTASIYGRAGSGYRAGGQNTITVNSPAGSSYKSDSLWNYELGFKGDLPDGSGRVEAAIFQIDWRDLQSQVFNAGGPSIGNAGKAQVRGIEFGGLLKPLRALTLRASLSFMDAKLLENSPGLGGKAGDRLPKSPRTAMYLNARYDFKGFSAPVFITGSLAYIGDRVSSFPGNTGLASQRLPAYRTIDVNGGVTVGGFEVGAYVRNLTDSRGQLSADTASNSVGAPTLVTVIRPRTIGFTMSRSF